MDAMPLNLMFGLSWGPGQILLVLLVIILLFGRGKISEFMGDFAKGIKSFKKGLSEDEPVATTPPAPTATTAKVLENDPLRTETKTAAGTQTKA